MRLILLILLALVASSPVGAAPKLIFQGKFLWTVPLAGFGGFSGLDIQADGRHFATVSDHGKILTGVLQRRNGRISGVGIDSFVPLHDLKGRPVHGHDTDSEGLVLTENGTIYVSFEGHHRVWRYSTPGGKATRTGTHPDFAKMQVNASLESLAIDQGGALYTMPERSGRIDRPFPVYRHRRGTWKKVFSIPRRGRFLASGSDFGPDGKFYLLERDFLWYRGFATRIRRFDLTDKGFTNEETLLETAYGDYDNLEGLATSRDAQGNIRLTMISDDNFNILQSTEFVEFLLPASKPASKSGSNPVSKSTADQTVRTR